ncbi:hypothetical protein FOL47_000488 [Perkinsus chesapeaki]|uniref:Uncharacterized protein n=1 Tax=Perkinsus chesapeaki TaxID=330153 RepID=A0A7J6KXN0_PERCH|nr:hypothetical protein FOL47_000488 [Perkinsus chesapeaki]
MPADTNGHNKSRKLDPYEPSSCSKLAVSARAEMEALQSFIIEGIEASWIDYVRTDTRLSIAIGATDRAQDRLRSVKSRLMADQERLAEASNEVARLTGQLAVLKEASLVHQRISQARIFLDEAIAKPDLEDIIQRCQLVRAARGLLEEVAPANRRGCPDIISSCLNLFEATVFDTIEGLVKTVTKGPVLTVDHLHLTSDLICPGLWIGTRALDVESDILEELGTCIQTEIIYPLTSHSGAYSITYTGFAREWSISLDCQPEKEESNIHVVLETLAEFLHRTVFSGDDAAYLAMGRLLWPAILERIITKLPDAERCQLERHMISLGFIDPSSAGCSVLSHASDGDTVEKDSLVMVIQTPTTEVAKVAQISSPVRSILDISENGYDKRVHRQHHHGNSRNC